MFGGFVPLFSMKITGLCFVLVHKSSKFCLGHGTVVDCLLLVVFQVKVTEILLNF